MNELALFAGAGGGILGGKLLGWRTVCAVEIDAYCAGVLVQRQNDGILPPFPIWNDVRTFDGKPWRGIVDVVSGGFPCQDVSIAGKGDGLDGERSGLWAEFARILGEVRPRYAFIENSPMLTLRGGDRVLSDLAALGYDARWGVVSAADAGAPHRRERIWIVADSEIDRRREGREGGFDSSGARKREQPFQDVANADGGRRQCSSEREEAEPVSIAAPGSEITVADAARAGFGERRGAEPVSAANGSGWWLVEPDVGRVAYGVASRVDRIKALGNGQVPAVAALAWRILSCF